VTAGAYIFQPHKLMERSTMEDNKQDNMPAPAPASRYPESMRAIFAAFAHHGKPLRGLMSTAKSSAFQGRFGRMFRSLPAATYGKTDAASRAALMTLGAAMTSSFDAPKDGFDNEESGIPALYTYFGQFIDHDLTFDPMTTLIQHSDPDAVTDFRTPALDLDNVYGRGPSDQPYMYDNSGVKFLPGDPLANGAPDLPRNNANPRRALIGDPRNDENSIVSQFQALMLRFHNRVVDDNAALEFPAQQRIVRWHYQWVVLHDFLARIVSAPVLAQLKNADGKFDKSKLKFFHWKNDPFMPVEFSVACYRLGHSMIRPGYRLNDDNATLLPIFPIPPNTIKEIPAGITPGLTGFQEMAKNRGIDWGRFIDLEGDVRPYGGDPDTVKPPTAEMKARLQFAYRIDTSVVTPLSVLPLSVASDPPPSLPQRNLLRGFELGLPTGQDVARAMGITPLTDKEILIGKAVDAPSGDDVLGKLSDLPQLSSFFGKCPLWTYILAEAARNQTTLDIPVTPPTKITTPQLGPVGGRIVAEVFLGMLFGDNDSFLSLEPNWTPTIRGKGTAFALRDIVAYALGK
jgi:hypothetical protein